MNARPDLEALLAETRWLGGLARQLTRSAADAEDLVQDTLRTAVERPPATNLPLRSWLATVLRNRLADLRRAGAARTARQLRFAADRSAGPDTFDVVAKAEAHRLLVEAVLGLSEPQLTCVLLRFFEQLPPRAIARRTGVPVATVHSRLHRALAELRLRLAASHGPRWQRALVPLLGGPSLNLFPLGVPLVNFTAKTALSAGAIAVVSLAFWWATELASPAPDIGAGVGAAPLASAEPPSASASASPAAASSERHDATPAAATSPAAPVRLRSVRGRVLDARGAGVPGVQLAFGDDGGRTFAAALTSGPGGEFATEAPPRATSLASSDSRWSTVLSGNVRALAEQECTVLVAPRLDLGGRVVDQHGAPVPNTAISVRIPAGLGADFGVLLDFSTPRGWRTVCDQDGRFRLADVPAVAAASLLAELGGWLPRFVPLPGASTELLELVLERPAAGATVVHGLVVDTWGAGVAGARVSAGAAITRSDAQGAFTLDLAGQNIGRLCAVARGMQPAVLTPLAGADGKPSWPHRVVLHLGPPPRSLAGRVTFADGRPAAGARVWIIDPLFVGSEGDAALAENLLTGEGRPFWNHVTADDAGAFRLDGLCDRAYGVRALDPRSLRQVTLDGVVPGRDVVLALPDAVFPRLRARVATRDGAPLADVHVRLQRPALEVQVPGGTRDEWSEGQSGRTDQDGVFHFTEVPTSGVELFAFGDTIMFAGKAIEPARDPDDFVLTVDRRMHLQVELAPPFDRGDRCRVLDATGKAMLLRIMRGNAATTNRSAEITEGRTHILSLGEGASTVVLLRAGVEQAQLPVKLVAGQVTTVRF